VFQEAVAARSNIVHELETPTVSRPEVCYDSHIQRLRQDQRKARAYISAY